jgi:hypothetical protein
VGEQHCAGHAWIGAWTAGVARKEKADGWLVVVAVVCLLAPKMHASLGSGSSNAWVDLGKCQGIGGLMDMD